ncbi:zinc ribbon domain-containing protein [Mariniphaga sp.]|uniref:zinc ribbon domain-containing protein n=1 Tax=Mariniphaga sp. TaxID=1954475 RepID=UPI0035642BCB
MSKSCEKCGKLVDSSDKFCPHCGNAVTNQTAANVCLACNHQNQEGTLYCEKCGTPLTEPGPDENKKSGPQTFSSAGNYSGKMIKGKTSKVWKIFRNTIIGIVLLGIIALIIWFQVDPEAGKKLTDVLMGTVFMIVFFFFGWLFMRGKKGRKSDWDDD